MKRPRGAQYARRPRKVRRVMTRRQRVPRLVRPRVPMMAYSRTFWFQNWLPSTVSTNDFWRYYTFKLSDVPNFPEFQSLFDQYRVNAVKWTFRPRYDGFNGNDTTDTTLPGITNQGKTMMHVCNDPKSIIVPVGVYNSTTLNNFFEQGKVYSRNGNRSFSVYCRTVVPDDADGINVARYIRAPWLNTSTRDITHRGFHIFAQDVNLTGVFGQAFDVYVTPYIMFKNIR